MGQLLQGWKRRKQPLRVGIGCGYQLATTWTNTYNDPKTITIVSVTLNRTTYTSGFSPTSFTLPKTSTGNNVTITLSAPTNSSVTVSIVYTVAGNPTQYTAGTGSPKRVSACSGD